MTRPVAIIAGAGPAGLTAAYELASRSDIKPIVLEATQSLGGISRTVRHQGNRMDIGGHRFFSKSRRVRQWWLQMMPLQGSPARDDRQEGREVPVSAEPGAPDPEKTGRVMLIRSRLSRIYFLRRFFPYPVSLSLNTVRNLGLGRTLLIGLSYLRARLRPIRPENSLEDFFVNRFGRRLYELFFQDYTEKVWGAPCREIRPEWGAQRVKGLSITSALRHAAKGLRGRRPDQDQVLTTLIEQFWYPKLGPGQLWEEVARRVEELGGEVRLGQRVTGLSWRDGRVSAARVRDEASGRETELAGDWFFSSMPVRELIRGLTPQAPPEVRRVARGLIYRDFMTAGLLVDRLLVSNPGRRSDPPGLVDDNWIYIQERDVRLGRLQVFNNWSPYLVADPGKVWLGLEYFCDEGDRLWTMADADFLAMAAEELARIDIIDPAQVRDGVVVRVPKAYPAYFGTYPEFPAIREFTDGLENLFLVGRNGMHRYNNQDHSMLTAMLAVDGILAGRPDKAPLWEINLDDEYHEEDSPS